MTPMGRLILVTGGAGFLGSVLVRTLLSHGHRVRVLDNLSFGGESLLGLWGDEGFEFMRGDVRSAETLSVALAGAEAVVHLAAIVGDPACARQPTLAREINEQGSLALFQRSADLGVRRFVFASTCSNYGKMRAPAKTLTEEGELSPVSLYAESKVATERALLGNATRNGVAVTVLRFATLYGISPRMRFDLTVNEFTAALFLQKKLTVYGEHFWRPYLHVRDAARAVSMVLEAALEKIAGEVFNVGDNSENYQKGQIVRLVQERVPHGVEISRVARAEDPRDYAVCFDKIRRVLEFRITRTVRYGIEELLDTLRQGIFMNWQSPRYRNA